MRPMLALPFVFLATPLLAVGDDDDTPPTPTETTTVCDDGTIWDAEAKACVPVEEQSLNDDTRYGAVRELAYAGAYDRALAVIASADDPEAPRFLNYRGFIARKQGDMADAMAFYAAALEKDPDYLLARSYMGQGLVAEGDIAGARTQLHEIASRGGRNTWAHASLKMALGGKPSSY